tara:strand:- start:1858 stop:2106 length:249 start_codon:yes stop_codon:yes gene_type:complete
MPTISDPELKRLNQMAELCIKWGKEKIWIVIYSHKHGVDAWPVIQNEEDPAPTEEQIIASLDTWEGEEEQLEILGPWERADA